ncbi:MAG: hypothetical protein IKW20_07415 [Bacteroidales bacterium]|nr:hypothetical protein [Bacteroidales bacterium]
MGNYSVQQIVDAASEMTKRRFLNDELDPTRQYAFDIRNEVKTTTRYTTLLWKTLNEVAVRAFKDQTLQRPKWEDLTPVFLACQSDNVKVVVMGKWVQIKMPKTTFLLSESRDSYFITSADRGTCEVRVPVDKLVEILIAFDAMLADIDSVVRDVIACCCAMQKSDEILTTTGRALVADLLEGKNIIMLLHNHKDRIYCLLKENRYWAEEIKFRTSLETFREDLKLACSKARIRLTTRGENQSLLAGAAKNNPVYEVLGKASFLNEVDIVPSLYKNTTSKRSLQFSGSLKDVFQINCSDFDRYCADAMTSLERGRINTMHSSALLSLLCFSSVSHAKPLILPIEGKPVKFVYADLEYSDIDMLVGESRDGELHFANLDVRLESENGNVILFLESKMTEYMSWGKQSDISDYVYGKHYSKMKRPMKSLGLEYAQQTDKDGRIVKEMKCLQAVKGATKVYAQGLKQMLSHTLGVSGYIPDDPDAKVYLGSILYRFPDHIDGGKADSYIQAHQTWCKGLNERLAISSNMKVIETPFIYQDVFKDENSWILPERVKEFYGF